VIFVDTNVFIYAVGREHPLRERARRFFLQSIGRGEPFVTSAEVMQELVHAYLPAGRLDTLDAALLLVESSVAEIWPIEAEDVRTARMLLARHPELGSRDLIHLACCRRRNAGSIQTFDRALAKAFAEERE
jgi:predicted nucleic acid-binding protein